MIMLVYFDYLVRRLFSINTRRTHYVSFQQMQLPSTGREIDPWKLRGLDTDHLLCLTLCTSLPNCLHSALIIARVGLTCVADGGYSWGRKKTHKAGKNHKTENARGAEKTARTTREGTRKANLQET